MNQFFDVQVFMEQLRELMERNRYYKQDKSSFFQIDGGPIDSKQNDMIILELMEFYAGNLKTQIRI